MKIIAAIIAAFQADNTLKTFQGLKTNADASTAKGPYFGMAPDLCPMPYVTLGIVPGNKRVQGFAGGSATATPRTVQVNIFGPGLVVVDGYALAVFNYFDRAVLSLSGGGQSKPVLIREPHQVYDRGLNTDKRRVYQGIVFLEVVTTATIGTEA